MGGAYDVTVSAVPLPAAAWLFGSALLGFVTYSARRSV
ncbi:MAG: VPLPA-CTERM sorting domain-containing protein [Candidatus Thiodiazotropha sp.]